VHRVRDAHDYAQWKRSKKASEPEMNVSLCDDACTADAFGAIFFVQVLLLVRSLLFSLTRAHTVRLDSVRL
jgi:hypothetical protein